MLATTVRSVCLDALCWNSQADAAVTPTQSAAVAARIPFMLGSSRGLDQSSLAERTAAGQITLCVNVRRASAGRRHCISSLAQTRDQPVLARQMQRADRNEGAALVEQGYGTVGHALVAAGDERGLKGRKPGGGAAVFGNSAAEQRQECAGVAALIDPDHGL